VETEKGGDILSEMRKLTPAEVLKLTGWTDQEAAERLEYSPATIRRKKKNGKWSLADLRIMTEAAQIPVELVIF
jgi:hypothetical protein